MMLDRDDEIPLWAGCVGALLFLVFSGGAWLLMLWLVLRIIKTMFFEE
jgi:hypothetical protein